ncbi:4a-hydroxytetrahydrobiopterin dehydratase [Hydrocarboniclastica marina]|uniref:Putative pterin-4-alpha-carbinolamine dehydratase n=1 Tax=Hydrocarboniclastica marina TaxID=2259620 RepID=A0A4P7XFJ7_9ALTE|nr:4a-hydroxytetrahydrobiopterin dehydratase [Hydrocarboniclastica marina]QCF25728.1 4a-hydroxytetrahydrobiopterin dehydratase [Hydrocarboniclastica marina]
MSGLDSVQCEPCSKDSSPMQDAEIRQKLEQVPLWHLEERNGEKQIERQYKFGNFAQALAFTRETGELAEQQGHHPALLTEWGKVTVTWWTHKIGGLHQNDFIMAAKTDALYADQ